METDRIFIWSIGAGRGQQHLLADTARHRHRPHPGVGEKRKGGDEKGGANTNHDKKERAAQKELEMPFPLFSFPPFHFPKGGVLLLFA